MRLVFISGTTRGGSGRSQRDLAGVLQSRGHDVVFLVDDERRAPVVRWLYAHLSDLSVRAASSPVGPVVERVRDSLARRTRRHTIQGVPHLVTPLPQNALPGLLSELRPDVVVANSVERWAWRLIHRSCEAASLPTMLYVREEDSLAHLDAGAVPDILVANTPSLAETLKSRGFDCSYVPSLVDTSVTRTDSARRVVLAINPIAIKGSDIVWKVAQRLPEIPFVVQEAWPLTRIQLKEIDSLLRSLPNVEFRRVSPPGPDLYKDARVLMAPYRVDSRPRVVLEAQANGIPVLASDVPALIEAVGEGGCIVPLEDVDQWVEALVSLWTDDALYEGLTDAARENSGRADVAPDRVARAFEGLLAAAAASAAGRA